MKTGHLLIALFFLLSFSTFLSAQKDLEPENWLSNLGGEYTNYYFIYYYKHYTKDDVPLAKEKLKSIRQAGFIDEWEGIYEAPSPVGDNMLVWNKDKGFFEFYFYHGLQKMDFGRMSVSEGVVERTSEKPSHSSNPKSKQSVKLVKIKVGERHFLVPETYIEGFCEEAVGLRSFDYNVSDYLAKQADHEKPVFGLPIVPAEYQKFVRQPINARIIKADERKLVQKKTGDGTVYNEEIRYYVTLDAGKNKGVKPEMDFYIPDLGEWLQIAKVSQNASVGVILRTFDGNRQEECWKDRSSNINSIPCKEIKAGMKVFTKF